MTAVSAPALLAGVWLGRRLRARFSERAFRALVAALLAASSGAILLPLAEAVAGALARRL
jgi:uncharacterized membrane protein YfcA